MQYFKRVTELKLYFSRVGILRKRDPVPRGRAGVRRGVPGARVRRARRAGGRVVGGGALHRARGAGGGAGPARARPAPAVAAPRRAAAGGRLPAAGRAGGRAAAAPGGAAPVTRAGGGAHARARPPVSAAAPPAIDYTGPRSTLYEFGPVGPTGPLGPPEALGVQLFFYFVAHSMCFVPYRAPPAPARPRLRGRSV